MIRTGSAAALVLGVVLAIMSGAAPQAQFQMPDPRQMSGIPRPVDDLPAGGLSVRLIRGDLSNNIVGHPVDLSVGGDVRTANTDESGRAEFRGVPPGAPVRASATVDGERLESQEFPMPAQGGIRLLLVATDPERERQAAAEAAAPAVKGQVVIGGDSRIIVEPIEDTVLVYYVLDIMNEARAPVVPQTPFTFTLQDEAVGTAVVQGSSPLASNNGREVTVAGPFPTGQTAVQVAAEYPVVDGSVVISQAFPAMLQEPVVIAKKIGEMRLASPQIDRMQESVAEGTPVVVGIGKALAAGQPLTVTIAGLPHHSSAPRTITLVLTGIVILAGAWLAMRPAGGSPDDTARRRQLVARREKLLQELVRLENDRRKGRVDAARYPVRREELVQSLEQVYGELDDDETGPEPASRAA
ncbi:MAG: hypothetical protein AB7Q29_11725 [Vicinamibacterales bacterium]